MKVSAGKRGKRDVLRKDRLKDWERRKKKKSKGRKNKILERVAGSRRFGGYRKKKVSR